MASFIELQSKLSSELSKKNIRESNLLKEINFKMNEVIMLDYESINEVD